MIAYFKLNQFQHLEYGKRNEPKAKSKYLEVYTSRHIHECGLFVNKQFGFLGATPDGIVCDNGSCGIIECKCPYSARNLTIDQAMSEIPNFMLHHGPNGQKVLDENHSYFAH